LTIEEAREMVADGAFAAGSMRPKVESAVQFLEQGGKRAIITCLECALDGLAGKRGTTIVP
jgi:carbamate kinase